MRARRVFEFFLVLAVVALGAFFYGKQASAPKVEQCPPFICLIDKDGKELKSFVGYEPYESMEEKLKI